MKNNDKAEVLRKEYNTPFGRVKKESHGIVIDTVDGLVWKETVVTPDNHLYPFFEKYAS